MSAADRLLTVGPELVEALDGLLTVARALPGVDAARIWLRDEKTGGAVLAAAGLAHQLNNLLAAVLGRVQLARATGLGSEVDRHLAMAELAVADAAELIRRLRTATNHRPVAGDERVDLRRIAEGAVELMRARWQDHARSRGIDIDVTFEGSSVPDGPGEAPALREVVMSLLENAIEAMPSGGRITVRTGLAEGSVYCEVADTGIGMSQEVRRRACEPFFTTKGPQRAGLGLTVSHSIIDRHAGELVIRSEPGHGTRVLLSIPVASEAGSGAGAPAADV